MRSNILILLSFLFIPFAGLLAQSTGGSVYSLYGLGEITPVANELNRGIGFAGIAVNSPYYVNLINSAANSRTGGYYSHIFNTGIYYNNTLYETNDDEQTRANGGLTHLNYWFRGNDKWTASLGITPFTNLGYSVNRQNVTGDQGIDYDVNYKGEGGINKLYFANSIKIIENLSLGVNLSLFLGSLRKSEIAVTQAQAENFIVVNNVGVFKGNIDFGLSYVIDLPKIDIGLGVIYDDATRLRAARITQLTNSSEDFVFAETEGDLEYVLPQKIGFGVSLMSPKIIAAADVEFNEWEKGEIEGEEDLQNTLRFSSGIDFTPNRQSEYYAERISYRAGFYIENSYLTIENTNFDRWGITGGISLPLNKGNMLTLSYHRKHNGTLTNDLIRETTNEFTLDLTIRNIWFLKSKFD